MAKQVRPWLAEPEIFVARQRCVRPIEEPTSESHQGQRRRPQSKSECTGAIFSFSPSRIERLANGGVHVRKLTRSKYLDGLPLYRQAVLLGRFGGTDVSRNTVAGSMVRAGQAVQPVINLLRDELLDTPLVFGDETELQVLKEPGRAAQTKSTPCHRAGAARRRCRGGWRRSSNGTSSLNDCAAATLVPAAT